MAASSCVEGYQENHARRCRTKYRQSPYLNPMIGASAATVKVMPRDMQKLRHCRFRCCPPAKEIVTRTGRDSGTEARGATASRFRSAPPRRFAQANIRPFEVKRMVPSLAAGAGAGVPLFPGATRDQKSLPCAGWRHPLSPKRDNVPVSNCILKTHIFKP